MCGIIGFLGSGIAQDSLIDGLRRLEYRGYDSAGVAFHEGMILNFIGRLVVLKIYLKLLVAIIIIISWYCSYAMGNSWGRNCF